MQKLRVSEKIYTYHIDFVGHVNNINYITWMENGRVQFLEAVGMPPAEIAKGEGIRPIITETKIEYKRPLFLENEVHIEVWISKLFNASAIMEFRFFNEKEELCASGYQKGLFINHETMRPARITPEIRAAFEQYLIEE